MSVRRSNANARRALGLLFKLLLVLAVFLFAQATSGMDDQAASDWRRFATVVVIVAIVVLPPFDTMMARANKRLAPWVVGHDFAWRLASGLLHTVAPFGWLAARAAHAARGLWAAAQATRAGRFPDRHRRAVGICLVAAISLRSLAAIGLLHPESGATAWHWVTLGPTYLLFGVTAPFVALLLMLRKGKWVLVTAIIWLLLGWAGVSLAALSGALLSQPHWPLLLYPLFAEPVHFSLFLAVGLADFLVQTAALHYLGGRTACYYTDSPETGESAEPREGAIKPKGPGIGR